MKILDIPFDEFPGSGRAYDYALPRTDAVNYGGVFTTGYSGNSLHLSGTAYALVSQGTGFLEEDFTFDVRFRLLGPELASYIILQLQFDENNGPNRFVKFQMDENLFGSHRYVLVRESDRYELKIDGVVFGEANIDPSWGSPTGFSFYADSFDEVSVEDLILDSEIVTVDPLNPLNMKINYSINRIPFSQFGIEVRMGDGMLDKPTMKNIPEAERPDYHGMSVDLSNPKVSARELEFDCWLRASGPDDLFEKVTAFNAEFGKPETQQLRVDVLQKPLIFQVFSPDKLEIKKRWNANTNIAEFKLKMIEPDPLKKVLKHVRTDSGSAEVTVSFTSERTVHIYWGDGEITFDAFGVVELSHTYAENGEYYPVIVGEIDTITSFSTSAIIVWSRL